MDGPDEQRAERFLVAFNAIDRELRGRLGLDRNNSFRSVVDRYASEKPWWRRDAESLRAFAELRNVVVHERFERFKYISIPAPDVVKEIEAIRDRLVKPKTVQQVAGRDVFTIDSQATLTEFLRLVEQERINQVPVYSQGTFQGLVTSKGVLRWLAESVGQNGARVDLDTLVVRELLRLEGSRHNCDFVARDLPVDEASFMFARNPQLEALLVTEHGKREQGLIGIMTQRDASHLFD